MSEKDTCANRDVFFAYAASVAGGAGVFFAHSMAGGAMSDAPVAGIYGGGLVPTAVAADGNRVAVAYVDPNGALRRIGVALSNTQGHMFETHATVSAGDGNIFAPTAAITGHAIAVSWLLRSEGGEERAGDLVRVVRVG